jgi:hypothetical protein
MPISDDPKAMSFDQFSVISQQLRQFDKQLDILGVQLNQKIDRLDTKIDEKLEDHEDRLRTLESRIALTISVGMGLLMIAILATWFIATQIVRGGVP